MTALHEDLVPYVEGRAALGLEDWTAATDWPMLRHPLVYQIPYVPEMNGHLNKLYYAKLERVRRCREAGEWGGLLWTYERPWRPEALFDIRHQIENAVTYWDLVAACWLDTEYPHTNEGAWRALLTSSRPQRAAMMTDADREVFDALPDEITVYRGFQHKGGERGWSWTMERAMGRWFATRLAGEPTLLAGVVHKDDVLAYFGGRGESEILTFNPRDVMTVEKYWTADKPSSEESMEV